MRDNRSSWYLFIITIGLLFVTFAPKVERPMTFIIGGLVIVLMGVILLRKNRRRRK